jgi:RNA polymerase sigma-70 factor (ECF subfamily)
VNPGVRPAVYTFERTETLSSDLQNAPDDLVMGHIAAGRSALIALLIARYERALLAFLRRSLAGAPEADDLFQETWIRVVRSAHTYDPTYRFSTWLFRIAWNQVRDHWTRKRATPAALGEAVLEAHPAATPSAEQAVLDRERAELASALVRELPPRLAEAIGLRFFEELTEKEMAVRLGVPAGTVKSRVHHGLKQLGVLLGGKVS